MKKRIILIAVAILILISFQFDKQISVFIESIRNFPTDYLLVSVAFTSSAFVIFFFLTSLFLWNENKRRWILPLWLSGLFSSIISYALKIIFHRPRPFQEGIVSPPEIFMKFLENNYNTWNFSFPSFQAILVFSALPILSKEFRKFKYFWFVFACLVAFSRLYFGVHYLSDILAGAVIGYLIGFVVVKLEEKYKFGKKIMKKLKL